MYFSWFLVAQLTHPSWYFCITQCREVVPKLTFFFPVLSYQLVILSDPVLSVIGQLKETRHCDFFFYFKWFKSHFKSIYVWNGRKFSFLLPALKKNHEWFLKMEMFNYSLVTMLWGQISTAMSQLLLVLVLFARTLSLPRSFCFVSCIVAKFLVDKVTSKLHCSAWAILTVSAPFLAKTSLKLHCSLSRKARIFQGRRTSVQGCAKKTVCVASVPKRARIRSWF